MAGGVQAGRLSIEIVAEVARLQSDLDKVKRSVKAASDEIASNAKNANDNLTNMGNNFQRTGRQMTATAGSTRMGMLQLSYQIGDLSQQFALGVPWQRVFMQQSGQILQAVQLLTQGTSKFAMFLQGPWGIALTFATVAITPLIGKLFETDEAAKGANEEIKNLAQEFDFASLSAQKLAEVNKLLADSNAEIERTAIGAAKATLIKAEADRDAASAAMNAAFAEYTRIAAFSRDPNFAEGNLAYAGQLEQIRKRMEELTKSVAGYNQTANRSRFNVDVLTAGLDENGRTVEALKQRIDELRISYQRTGNPAQLAAALEIQEQINKLQKENKSGAGRTSRAGGKSEAEKQIEETDRFIQSLRNEIEAIGLDEKAVRQLQIARAQDEAITQAQKNAIAQLNVEREEAIAKMEREKLLLKTQEETKNILERVEATRREAQVLELVGYERERALLQLEQEAALNPLLLRQQAAMLVGEVALSDELQNQIDLINEQFGLQIQMSRRSEQLAEWEERYGTLRDFLKEVNKTPEEMRKSFESIKMRGLDTLNDSLVEAIVNFKDLGDVAVNVTRQIIAELLRLQIQKYIIGPLANSLGLALPGGGGGMPINLLGGTPYGGGMASGGAVNAGMSYVVGERGPEVLTMGSSGYITPNDRISNKSVVEIVDTTGLFRFRVNGQIAESTPAIAEVSSNYAASKSSWQRSRRVG